MQSNFLISHCFLSVTLQILSISLFQDSSSIFQSSFDDKDLLINLISLDPVFDRFVAAVFYLGNIFSQFSNSLQRLFDSAYTNMVLKYRGKYLAALSIMLVLEKILCHVLKPSKFQHSDLHLHLLGLVWPGGTLLVGYCCYWSLLSQHVYGSFYTQFPRDFGFWNFLTYIPFFLVKFYKSYSC